MTHRTIVDPVYAADLEVLRAEIKSGLRFAELATTLGIVADQRARCREYAEQALEVALQSAAHLRHPGRSLDRELTQIDALTAAIARTPRDALVSAR